MIEVCNCLKPVTFRRGLHWSLQCQNYCRPNVLLVHLKPTLCFISEALHEHFQMKLSADAKNQMAPNGRGGLLMQENPT